MQLLTMSDPQDLEKTAMAYAADAVEFEKQGESGKALLLYQKAIECLDHLVERYPRHGFSKIYSDRADLYRERAMSLQEAVDSKAEFKEPPTREPEEALKAEPAVDLAPILLEINRKLDELTASVAQLKGDVVNIKVNIDDVVGKTEQSQKETVEIRNLLYSIKYDR